MRLQVRENHSIVLNNFDADEIVISAGSSVTHIVDDLEISAEMKVTVGPKSSYKAVFLQDKGSLSLCVNLDYPQAAAEVSGIFLSNSCLYNNILINHNAAHTRSKQFFKGIAWDKGLADINLKTFVSKGIKAVEGYQLIKGLVLSSSADIKTKPELEIYSDDSICSHGSAIGTLDHKQVFYMLSRGIPEREARYMLIRAFLAEVSDKVEQEGLHRKFIRKLEMLNV